MNPHADITDEEAEGEFECRSKKELRDEDQDFGAIPDEPEE